MHRNLSAILLLFRRVRPPRSQDVLLLEEVSDGNLAALQRMHIQIKHWVLEHLLNRGSLGRIRLQQLGKQRLDFRTRVGKLLSVFKHLGVELHIVVPFEGKLFEEHEVENHAQAPNVHLEILGLLFEHLWSDVAVGPAEASPSFSFQNDALSEVANDGPEVSVEQNVAGIQVAVDNLLGVDFLEAKTYLMEDLKDFFEKNIVRPKDVVLQRVVLHGKEYLDEVRGDDFAPDLLDDVRMLEELVDPLAHDDSPQFEEVLSLEWGNDDEKLFVFVPYFVQLL